MSIKKITLFFHFLFILVFLVAFYLPGSYYWCLLAFNLIFLFYGYKLKTVINSQGRFSYFVLPWVFINSLFFYSSLLASKLIVILFLFLGLLLSYYYFKGWSRYLLRNSAISTDGFSTWTDVLSLLSVFLVSSFAYGLNYFLNIASWVSLLIIVLVLLLAIWQNIFIINKNYQESLFLSFLFLLSISPIAGALSFFPFNFNFLGLILAITYYFSLSFMRFSLLNSLTNKKIKYNLIFIIALFLVLFSTIKWR